MGDVVRGVVRDAVGDGCVLDEVWIFDLLDVGGGEMCMGGGLRWRLVY